ncbi:hypothetical protein SNE40_008568 [Patella caerulea]|uniref:Large ribosomal subunit protein bL36m n=1 Tax=Patella caerulea TaxID=87958 RepID=A0AAN8Q3U0_PATCE
MAVMLKSGQLLKDAARIFTSLMPSITAKSGQHGGVYNNICQRTFSVASNPAIYRNNVPQNQTKSLSNSLLQNNTNILNPFVLHSQIRHYKSKNILRLRCSGCYFVKRNERLFVECKLKPRHKQMKKMPNWALYKEDYSEGNIERALHWNYFHERDYQMGNNKFAKYNWLEGKLGHTI